MDKETKRHLDACVRDYAFRLADRTLAAYATDVEEFYLYAQTGYQHIRKADIRKWIAHWQESGQKPTTLHRKLASLRWFYAYLQEEQQLNHNPTLAIPMPRIGDSLPHYLTREELEELRNLVKGKIDESAIIETLYSTGVRAGELIAMERNDISWEERSIHIRDGKGKKERIVYFSRRCQALLEAYLSIRKDDLPHLFLNSRRRPLIDRTLRLRFEGYSEQLGFNVSPHTMRHTFAAHLAEKNMPLVYIQDLLGHDNIEVTKIYARLHEEARKKTFDYYL